MQNDSQDNANSSQPEAGASTKDVYVRQVDLEGVTAFIVTGATIEELEASPQLYEAVRERALYIAKINTPHLFKGDNLP